MFCPHCGEKIEPKVHLCDRSYGSEIRSLCGCYPERLCDDRSRVTCLNCQRTKAFKEAK